MSRNLSVARKCNELKAELQAGNKKTLVDVLLQWVGRGKHLSPVAGIFVFFFLTYIIGFILAAILGELNIWQKLIQNISYTPLLLVWSVFGLLISTAGMIVANVYFHNIVAVIRDHMLNVVESQETVDALGKWVNLLCNKRLALLTSVIGGICTAPIPIATWSNIINGSNIGIGFTILMFLFSAQTTIFFGIMYGVLLLAIDMKSFELRLFEADPAGSEIIGQLSGLLNWFVYLVAAYGAVQTFSIVTLKLVNFTAILVLFWIPIVAIFVASQYGLAQIIQRAKWKTLNKTQQKIALIQQKNSVLKKEDQENIIWLLDYHDRVKATRNSAFDLNAGISFLNSMLLPLIGFLLGNFDKIIDFFR